MLKIVYGKEGTPISDFDVDAKVDQIINFYLKLKYSQSYLNNEPVVPPNDFTYITSSELCFMVFGLRVLEDKIHIDEIEFYFEDKKLNFHPYLGIEDPKEEIGFYSKVIDKAVRLGYKKMVDQRLKDT